MNRQDSIEKQIEAVKSFTKNLFLKGKHEEWSMITSEM